MTGRRSGARAVDPRVERSRRAILQAALDELAAVGYGAFTIESVANRAATSKATVYRHWRNQEALIAEALAGVNASIAIPRSGSLRDRIVTVLDEVTRLFECSAYSSCLPALIQAARRDAEVEKVHRSLCEEHRVALSSLLQDSIRDRRAGKDEKLAALVDAAIGSIFFRHLLGDEPRDAEAIADHILSAL